MTSPKLQMIERQLGLHRQPEKPPVDNNFGAAIEQIIEKAVQERVAEALERHKQSRQVRSIQQQFDAPPPYTDYRQIPPTPRTAPPKDMTATMHRDEEGKVKYIEIGNLKFQIQRDSLGRALRMIQTETPL